MARSAREREESLRETQAGPVYDRLGPKVWILGGVMVLIGLVTTYLILQDFRSESYIYLAFYSIPANAAISFFPHEPVLIYFGKFANLWLAAAAATVGTVVAGVMDHTVFVPLLNHRTIQRLQGQEALQAVDRLLPEVAVRDPRGGRLYADPVLPVQVPELLDPLPAVEVPDGPGRRALSALLPPRLARSRDRHPQLAPVRGVPGGHQPLHDQGPAGPGQKATRSGAATR